MVIVARNDHPDGTPKRQNHRQGETPDELMIEDLSNEL
jgi:hypothetical protein